MGLYYNVSMEKRGISPVRDFELENLAIEDIARALNYIGKGARGINIYQDSKPRKAKNDPCDSELPLFAINPK